MSNTILNVLIMMLMAKVLNEDGADFGMIPIEILIPSVASIIVSLVVFLVIDKFKKLKVRTSIYIYNMVYFFALLTMGLNVSGKEKSGINNDLYLLISLILSFLIILIAVNLIKRRHKQSDA
ncbi:hypothetical protein LF887_06095 [Chryseobacterium sp. MEBOG06]|uniref:hypothetical protein n=1 Tax=Chryseobacterium sp. MEBOG06 TaxID=2879938 RepID=UPI001F489D4C|nr:hypothetical protein [Chryseobacterium sp. MEBOG06]UKB85194.1 hypothetical protein LF887_06095 [Chryseobacterium sp. MEBOG06]